MNIKKFTFNPWQENTYIVYDETGECALVDMGCISKDDQMAVKTFVDDHDLKVKYLLNTHLHIDHILGNAFAKATYNAPLLAHENDEFLIENAATYAEQIGFKLQANPPSADQFIDEGDIIELGETKLKVMHVPGHSPGSLVYYHEASGILLSGDVLFYESIGRTDLIYGNHSALIKGITSKILSLPDETQIHPGHGPQTSIAHEKTHNPFLKQMC